jgi:predicted acylesterase/phospholipase RssA
MAALVFAGPKYDATLREIYTNRTSSDVYIDKGASGLASDSLYDDAPLRKEIERIVTKAFLADVAAEHAKGRRLYVATTNLDAGELVVWDMGAIAAGDRADPLQMFQKVMRASAAVPAFFPPVYIKPQKGKEARQAHVDGGVKAPVLVKSFMFEPAVPGRALYVVVNGSLSRFNARKPVGAKVSDIGRKSITELLRTTLDQSLYQGYALARNSGADFSLIAIPDDIEPSTDALDFNKTKMRALYRQGYEHGRSGRPWLKEPPRLAEAERIKGPASAGPVAKAPAPKAAGSAAHQALAADR